MGFWDSSAMFIGALLIKVDMNSIRDRGYLVLLGQV